MRLKLLFLQQKYHKFGMWIEKKPIESESMENACISRTLLAVAIVTRKTVSTDK